VVTLTGGPEGDRAVLEVSDDGPGLAAGLDPFARGVSGSGSTGYGLWLAREIAAAHGGTLDLVPAETGARFRLALPRADAGG
jgi:signal transduction histidine kinase